MISLSSFVHTRPSLGTVVAMCLLRGIQAGVALALAGLLARETRRQLAGLDRRSLADIGVPLNGPRSLATRRPWDTSNQGW